MLSFDASDSMIESMSSPGACRYLVKVFAVGGDMKVIFWDDAMTTLTSVPAATAIGQPISSLFNEQEYDECLLNFILKATQGIPTAHQQMSYLLSDGSESLLLVNVSPNLDDRDCVDGAIVEMVNITSLSQERLEKLIHSKS